MFFFAIFTAVDLIFFICQNKDMIQFLFDRSDAAWVFAPDHISDLFWKRELLFSDNLFVFYNIDGDIVIDNLKYQDP